MTDKVILTLWPSTDEIWTAPSPDPVHGGLAEYHRSVRTLREQFSDAGALFKGTPDRFVHEDAAVIHVDVTQVAEVILLLSAARTVLPTVLKLLDTWIASRNGRRIRFNIGDVEVEATQLPPDRVLELLDIVQRAQDGYNVCGVGGETYTEQVGAEAEVLQAAGFEIVPIDAPTRQAEKHQIAEAVRETALRAKNLENWKQSGQSEAWVEEHRGAWHHSDWVSLLDELAQSEFWPMVPDAVGLALEELKMRYWKIAEN